MATTNNPFRVITKKGGGTKVIMPVTSTEQFQFWRLIQEHTVTQGKVTSVKVIPCSTIYKIRNNLHQYHKVTRETTYGVIIQYSHKN